MTKVPGIEWDAFVEWFSRSVPGYAVPTDARLLTGGHSNVTIRLSVEGGDLVLRRGPLGLQLESANDMVREFTVQSALQESAVPVPRMIHVQRTADPVTGVDAPFYLMSAIEGRPLGERADNAGADAAELRAAMLDLARRLAELHLLTPSEVGLGEFGRPEGYLARQLSRWGRQLDALPPRDLPLLRELGARLAPAPDISAVSILHGDYKPQNALFRFGAGTAQVAAILDWEMATLGDPLADLSVFGLYWVMPFLDERIAGGFTSPVDAAAGYPRFSELLDAYREVRPFSDDLRWHVAFACFKIGVINELLYQRELSGTAVAEGDEQRGPVTEALADTGLQVLAGRDILQEA